VTRQLLPPHYFYRCEQRPTLAWARKPFPHRTSPAKGSARSVGISAHSFRRSHVAVHGSGRLGKRIFDGIDMRALGLADLKTVGDDGVIVQIYKPSE
jgi:hypothetical protein